LVGWRHAQHDGALIFFAVLGHEPLGNFLYVCLAVDVDLRDPGQIYHRQVWALRGVNSQEDRVVHYLLLGACDAVSLGLYLLRYVVEVEILFLWLDFENTIGRLFLVL
jgi:hypothetical protein